MTQENPADPRPQRATTRESRGAAARSTGFMGVPDEARQRRACYEVEVAAVSWPAPRLVRLTLQAPQLAELQPTGADEWVTLLLPRDDQPLVLPEPGQPVRQAVRAMPESVRPWLRWYTVRAHRPEASQIDVDFVIHEPAGPASDFATRAKVGDTCGLYEAGGAYQPPGHGQRHLLVADESAAPALLAISDQWRALGLDPAAARVLLEVADPEAIAPLAESYFEIEVLQREHQQPSGSLVAAVIAQEDLAEFDYAWICGESRLAATVRREVIRRGLHRNDVYFSGYWRQGRAIE